MCIYISKTYKENKIRTINDQAYKTNLERNLLCPHEIPIESESLKFQYKRNRKILEKL